jgi:hypothetical protein
MSLVLNNSIGWSCLQMSGGWKRIGWICALIAVAAPLLIFGSLQLNSQNSASTLSGWYVMLGILQGGLLGIGVPSRVHAAIKRDRVGKLFESHRLMPVPAGHAVAGYIVGSNLLLLACIGTLFLVGLIVSVPAQQDWRGWIAIHGAAAGLSATVCCFVAFSTAWLPKFNPALLGVILGPTLGAVSATFLPPLRVLLAPYVTGFADLQRGTVTPDLVISIAAQVLLSAIFFVGACRRYRRDDVPALGFLWGFALLVLWIAMTLIGILATEPLWRGRRGNESESVSYIVAVSLSLLLAIGPIASSASAMLRWRERRATDPHFIEQRPTGLRVATLLVCVAVMSLLLAAPKQVGSLTSSVYGVNTSPIHLWFSGAAIVLFILTIASLAQAAARMRFPALYLIIAWLILTWILPPMLDGVITLIRGNFETYPHALSAVSTPFAFGLIWADQIRQAQIGLGVQAVTVLSLAIAWIIIKRSNSRRRDPVLASAIA